MKMQPLKITDESNEVVDQITIWPFGKGPGLSPRIDVQFQGFQDLGNINSKWVTFKEGRLLFNLGFPNNQCEVDLAMRVWAALTLACVLARRKNTGIPEWDSITIPFFQKLPPGD